MLLLARVRGVNSEHKQPSYPMPKKIREVKELAGQAGFILQKRRGKGSHTYWIHPLLPTVPLTIPGKDGDDAPRYIERKLAQALQALEKLLEDQDD
jgi:predicted RNA binding protein YcfA (HicA-like mRNA interferase family)